MRYTTVIDITEVIDVYRNKNARLVYLHLALKCGYQDSNRDLLNLSLRNLAVDVGLSLSATRHAARQLTAAGLLSYDGKTSTWQVKKWLAPEVPTPRPKQTRKETSEANKMTAQWDEQVREFQQKCIDAARDMTREELEQWLHELEEGRSLMHRRISLKPNQNNINWLKSVIKNK